MVLDKDPLCVGECRDEGRLVPSLVADHIIALRDGGGWEIENGQGLCVLCHARKTARETAMRREKHPRRVA